MRLQFKLILLFIAISIVPFSIIGYYTYTLSAESMENHAIMHLNSVAETKANHIDAWLAELRGATRVIALTPSVVQEITVLTTADPESEEYQQAAGGMARFGDIVTDEYTTFDEIFVLDPDGIVITSTKEGVIGADRQAGCCPAGLAADQRHV